MNGYYPETDEEFYNLISNNLHEVIYTDNFKISQEEKKNLWFTIYETAQRYEEQKQIDLVGNTKKFVTAFKGMFNGLSELLLAAGETIPLLEKTVSEMYSTVRTMKENGETIERIKQKVEELERIRIEELREKGYSPEDIERMYNKIKDRNSIVEQIIQGMKNQG